MLCDDESFLATRRKFMPKIRIGLFFIFVFVFAGLLVFNTRAVRNDNNAVDDVSAAVSLQQVLATDNLANPVYVTNAKDMTNRLFIIEQGGTIKLLQPGARTTTNFLNITSKVACCGERGLLGLAFHPNFAGNRKFYVNYTCTTTNNPSCPATGTTIISEFLASASDPNTADPATERILLPIAQPFSNHNGGMIEFGPDGYLYIGMGDGGSGNDPGNRAQNINDLLGKMLRIDVNIPQGSTQQYLIPPTNPFVGVAGADEIMFTGLRNPWRWSFDRGNPNVMWIGDVGQNAIEEIDRVDLTVPPSSGSGARNFGWRVYEGNQCTNLDPCVFPQNYIAPFAQYNQTASRRSVTGGYVYRGKRGTFTNGTYVFGDYVSGELFTLVGNTPTLLSPAGFLISSFGEDEAGEIYACRYSSTTGGIYKLVDAAVPMPRNENADFDGDFRTDLSVFRSGVWYHTNSFDGGFSAVQFGIGTDTVVPGDYDGDGKTDRAVFRPSEGRWYVLNSGNSTVTILNWGLNGDRPVVGDYDGDKKNDFAVFRPNEGNWYVLNSSNGSFSVTNFGIGSDTTVQSDYTGDGRTDIAVWRGSTGVWYVLPSGVGSPIITQWGITNDIPIKGDFDGDNKTDLTVYRAGVWYVLRSSNNSAQIINLGIATDMPVPGDYDADDKSDIAVYRDGIWYILRSFNSNIVIRQFGIAGDTPIPAAY
jgi:glucose/arabinose dehydrogenase/(2Fe-2S) ferredoxin